MTMLTSFFGPRQNGGKRLLEVKLLSGIQSRAEERNCQPQHFIGAPAPLPHNCKDLSAAAAAGSSHCQRIHRDYSRNRDASKWGHTTSSANPSGAKRTTKTQRATDFKHSCRRATTRELATFHYQSWQEFQPTVSSLCHSRRMCTHLWTL